MSIEWKIKKLRQQNPKEGKTQKNSMEWRGRQKTTTNKTDNTCTRNKSKCIGEKKETQKITGQVQAIQTKQHLLKAKENSTNKLRYNTNNLMQGKQNKFGEKYKKRNSIKNGRTYQQHAKKNCKDWKEVNIHLDSRRATIEKVQNWKTPGVI